MISHAVVRVANGSEFADVPLTYGIVPFHDGNWKRFPVLWSQIGVARAARDYRRSLRNRGGAGVDHSAVQPTNRAGRRSLLYDEALVAVDHDPFVGVRRVPGSAALAWFALVEEGVSRHRVYSVAGVDLVCAAEPFRVDVQSTRERNLCENE